MAEDIWSGECSMDYQGEDFDEFVKALGIAPQTVVISMKRSWSNRLFTLPWRPLHGWIVFTGDAQVSAAHMRPDGEIDLTVTGVDTLTRDLRIRAP